MSEPRIGVARHHWLHSNEKIGIYVYWILKSGSRPLLDKFVCEFSGIWKIAKLHLLTNHGANL